MTRTPVGHIAQGFLIQKEGYRVPINYSLSNVFIFDIFCCRTLCIRVLFFVSNIYKKDRIGEQELRDILNEIVKTILIIKFINYIGFF